MRATLKDIPGVSDIDVDFQRALATFLLDTKKNSPEAVAQQLGVKSRQRYTATVLKNAP